MPSTAVVVPELLPCEEGAGFGDAPLRVATYNIKSGLHSSLDEVAAVLESLDADVIALQEVDYLTDRTGGEDQPALLAGRLGMQHAFTAARTEAGGDYGVALLSHLPFERVERVELASTAVSLEPRVALDATLCLGERKVRAVSVHADVLPWAGAEHAKDLARALGEVAADEATLVAGDLNARPGESGPLSLLATGLVDVIAGFGELPTFATWRIDYVLADRSLADLVREVKVLDSDASDHRPVVAEFGLDED